MTFANILQSAVLVSAVYAKHTPTAIFHGLGD